MRNILIFLIAVLICAIVSAYCLSRGDDALTGDALLLVHCSLIGMVAGVLYCLRAVYVNQGLKRWDSDWHVWYYLRPITSGISGFASTIFLQAGILALSSKPELGSTPYGYYAIAFIAGYNVDFFMKKIENVAQELWGIEKSRASQDKEASDTNKDSENDNSTEESK